MTRYSHSIKSPPGSDTPGEKTVARFVRAARVILAFERGWPLLWPASGVAGLFLALAFCGLLPLLPWPLHALILAGFVTAIGLLLTRSLSAFVWPGWHEAARRLEAASALKHRPISEADDALAAGAGDAFAEALWEADRKNRLAHLGRLKLFWPHAGLQGRDRKRLRYGVLALLLVAFVSAWGAWGPRLASAFGPAGLTPGFDAWIDPPTYTGVAPVYLGKDRVPVRVPAGSVLNVRVHGAGRPPFLSLKSLHFPYWPVGSAPLAGKNGEYAVAIPLLRDVVARLRAVGRTIGRWDVSVIPDKVPTVSFTAPPAGNERSALKLSFRAADDYGVVSAQAIITPADGRGAPLVVDLAVPPGKDLSQTVTRDLTSHPYAGLPVDIVIEVTDAAGQTGRTSTTRSTLPQLNFTDPLARALIELRRMLAQRGWDARGHVVKMLDALSVAPENFYVEERTIYLAQRHAFWALKLARTEADLTRVQALLWQMAVVIEQGGSQSLAQELSRQQQELNRLLSMGAPQDQIDAQLMRYAQTMQRYLQSMGQESRRAQPPADPSARTLGPNELNDLLAAIQTLSQSGDRAKAAQLLSVLQNLLENVRMSPAGGSGAAGAAPPNPALRALSDLADRQRNLMDKTFRGGMAGGGDKAALAREQDALKNVLKALQQGQKKPSSDLQKAGELMDQARAAIAMGDLPRAGTLQKYVLDALRKSAASMAATPKEKDGADPFGRAGGRKTDTPMPSGDVLRRARDILIELRQKAGEMGRPQEEREYIERLLKQF